MKTILAFLLIVTSCAYATNKKEMTFTNLPCKQKILPLRVDYQNTLTNVVVALKAETDIPEFKVVDVRGIDGLILKSVNKPAMTDLKKGDSIQVESEIEAPTGLSYLILDVEGKVAGKIKKQSLAVPIGEARKEEKTISNKLKPTRKKRHIMKLE